MNSKKKLFENFNLYAVTNFDKSGADILNLVDKAYRGGAGIVQLRTSGVSDITLSCHAMIRFTSVNEVEGNSTGMNKMLPSFNGGINSCPKLSHTGIVTNVHNAATTRLARLYLSVKRTIGI